MKIIPTWPKASLPKISVCRICQLYNLGFFFPHQQNYRLDIKINI